MRYHLTPVRRGIIKKFYKQETTGGRRGKLRSHRGELSNRGEEGKAERFPHRGSVLTSTHQPERLLCSPTRTSWGWELRFGLQKLDPRERTELGCVNTA